MDIKKKHWVGLVIATAATVLGGLILRGLGYLDDLWRFLSSAAVELGYALTASVEVPGWILLLLVVLVGLLAWAAWPRFHSLIERRLPHSNQERSSEPHPEEIWNKHLDQLDRKILVCMGARQGTKPKANQLVTLVDSDRLRVDTALDKLMDLGLVDATHNYLYGSSYFLTRSGRELLLELDVV